MRFNLDEAAVRKFFFTPGHPGISYCAKKGDLIERQARANASGPIIGRKTGNLLRQLRSSTISRGASTYVEVGTSATGFGDPDLGPEPESLGSFGFSYPAWHDQNGRPWLTNAVLSAGFRRGS